MSPDTISEFPEELQGTYTCQVVQPGKEGTEIIPTRKEEEPEIDVVGMTDEEKSMEYTEPSQTKKWYENVELLHGPPLHNLPTDEIEKEEIDLTKEQERDKITKRTKEMAANDAAQQTLSELDTWSGNNTRSSKNNKELPRTQQRCVSEDILILLLTQC